MGKKIWLMGLLFAAGVLVGLGATTVFAQEPPQPGAGVSIQEMQQACVSGDYETMLELHNEYCGGGGNWSGQAWNGNAGQFGMMGNGWRGMMGRW